MCFQLRISKIKIQQVWSEKTCKLFKKFARSDLPIECTIYRQSNRNNRVLYNDLPHTWPDVFEVANLFVMGSKKTIEQQMIENINV